MSQKKYKISMIGTLPPIKGISDYCFGLVESLSQKVDIDFINFHSLYPEKYYPGGTKKSSYRLSAKNVTVYDVIKWYNPFTWIKAGLIPRTKIVHIQWWAFPLAPVFITIMAILKLRNKTVIITLHNIMPHEKNIVDIVVNKLIIKLSDNYVIHSDSNKSALNKIYNLNKNISVIPHGSINTYSKNDNYEKNLDVLKINPNEKNILFFGNIRDYKGLDILLEAIGLLVNKYKCQNIKCVIAGQLWESWDKYSNIIERLNISNYVYTHLTFIPDDYVDAFFRSSYVIVLPYKYFDSQSGIGSIALNYEKPIMVTNVGGLLDYVSYPEAVFNKEDPSDLAKKLYDLIIDEKLYAKLKESSIQKRDSFSWNSVSDLTYKLYMEIEK